MQYVYKFNCLITESQIIDIQNVMSGSLIMDLNYKFIYEIKEEFEIKPTKITIDFDYGYNQTFKITVRRLIDEEILCDYISSIDYVHKLLGVYILDFRIDDVCYELLLNFNGKEPAGIDGDFKNNINKLNLLEKKTKGDSFKELFNQICYFNFNSILEIIYISYVLCCIGNNDNLNNQGIFLKKKFGSKLNEVGINFKDILKDIRSNPNDFKKNLDNIDMLNVNDLCFTLLGIVFMTDDAKSIQSKIKAMSNYKYYNVVENIIRTNKGIELF